MRSWEQATWTYSNGTPIGAVGVVSLSRGGPSSHHRQRRRNGGNHLANLLLLHPGCHRGGPGTVTAARTARKRGFIVSFAADPLDATGGVPEHRGKVLLDPGQLGWSPPIHPQPRVISETVVNGPGTTRPEPSRTTSRRTPRPPGTQRCPRRRANGPRRRPCACATWKRTDHVERERRPRGKRPPVAWSHPDHRTTNKRSSLTPQRKPHRHRPSKPLERRHEQTAEALASGTPPPQLHRTRRPSASRSCHVSQRSGPIAKDRRVTHGPAKFNFRGIDNILQAIHEQHGPLGRVVHCHRVRTARQPWAPQAAARSTPHGAVTAASPATRQRLQRHRGRRGPVRPTRPHVQGDVNGVQLPGVRCCPSPSRRGS